MATSYGGYMGKVLKLDLSTRTSTEYPWTDAERSLYLGGKIMAAKILYDNLGPDVQPLSPENWLVITTGPLTGSGAPMSSRFNISGISPLTNFIASSNCGGDFGLALKKAGYDALIISGKAEDPVWIEIIEDKIIFHDAGSLWGKTTGETQALLGTNSGKIVIGPAGENMVKYAGIFSQERTAGRAGLGAVMGAKKLKAVTATGGNKVKLDNEAAARKLFQKWTKTLLNHPLTGTQLAKFGTAGLVSLMQNRKILATRNFKYGQFKDFALISGEALAEKYLINNKGCVTCPIQCGRQVEVHGKKVKGPELETLGLLGANIENNNLPLLLEWNYLLDELGMDTISTGGSIAFAMELNEQGLWSNGLQFGKTEGLAGVFTSIAYRTGIGADLAEGVKYLAAKYGGHEFAIHSKGLELSAYEPRSSVGQGLGYAVANRGGCHLNSGYTVLLEGLGLAMDPYTTRSKAELNVVLQNLMEATSAGGSCLFSLYTSLPAAIINRPNSVLTRMVNKGLESSGGLLRWLNSAKENSLPFNLGSVPQPLAIRLVTGMHCDFGRFRAVGERGFNLERLFNLRRGLSAEQDTLPHRLTGELQDSRDARTKVPLAELKQKYYLSRGWDERGVPTQKTLHRLMLPGEEQ